MFKKFTIKMHLLMQACFMSLLMIMIGFMGVYNTSMSNDALRHVYYESVIPLTRLKVIADMFNVNITKSVNRVANGLMMPNDAIELMDKASDNVSVEWRKYSLDRQSMSPEERGLVLEFEALLNNVDSVIGDIKAVMLAGDKEKLTTLAAQDLPREIDPLVKVISTLIDIQLSEVKEEFERANDNFGFQKFIAIASVTVGIISTFISLIALISIIVRRLNIVSVGLEDIASGKADLTQRVTVSREDEVGKVSKNFNSFLDRLLSVIKRVQKSGIQVTTSVTAIKATSKQLERTINDFGSFTSEVGATAKEISATSRELVTTMSDVSDVATNTSDLASQGQKDLNKMEMTMSQMEDASKQITSKLAVISEKAANITTVVTTITKIADQTNLLSLNASIEAEKAGEYGLGFAVVAREIRRLADQVAMATLDIEQMVKEMKGAVSAGVMEMDKFSQEVRKDVEDVRNIGGQLAQIIAQVQTLLPRFESVHEGVQAQAEGAQQISDSMVQLKDAVEETAESLNETNLAVDNLSKSTDELQKGVSGFQIE